MIRLGLALSLIFFMFFSVPGCKQKSAQKVKIVWLDKQAIEVLIPKSLLKTNDFKNINDEVQVRLKASQVRMLGNIESADENFIFKPLVPLSPGRHYDIFYENNLIAQLTVPFADTANAPYVSAIYPSVDTVPENLLKIYLQFSSPMREGEALQHIYLLNEKADTLPGIFLDLQPELWNEERSALTLWLDPGRVKRDLIPNQRFGNPLKKGSHYTLVIDNDWKSTEGLTLRESYIKKFTVDERDEISPRPELWIIHLPSAKTTERLRIDFKEQLDYFLVKETVTVVNEKGIAIDGSITLLDNENGMTFIPETPWQPGRYRLRVASYLEDLAGNNLNRPFDRDVLLPKKKDEAFFERVLEIR